MAQCAYYDPHTLDISEYIEEIFEKQRQKKFTSPENFSETDQQILDEWDRMRDHPTVASLPFYPTRLAPVPPLIVRMPEPLFGAEEWQTGSPLAQLLFQLIAISFSSKWWLEFAPPPADEDETAADVESDKLDDDMRQLIERLDQAFEALVEALPDDLKAKLPDHDSLASSEQSTLSHPAIPMDGKCPPRLLVSVSKENDSIRKAVDELFSFQLDGALQVYLEEQMSLYVLARQERQTLPDNPLQQELNRLRGTTGNEELDQIEQRWAQILHRYHRFQRWYRQTCPHLLPEMGEDPEGADSPG